MIRQLTPKRVTIGEYEFAIFPFPAFTAATISGDLAKFLGPLVAGFLPALTGSGGTTDGVVSNLLNRDMNELVPTIIMALNTMDGAVVERILKQLLVDHRNISVEYRDENGKLVQEQLTYDLANEIFIYGTDEMIRLAVEVCKLNFGDFFNRLFRQYGSQSETTAEQIQKNTDISTKDGFVTLS